MPVRPPLSQEIISRLQVATDGQDMPVFAGILIKPKNKPMQEYLKFILRELRHGRQVPLMFLVSSVHKKHQGDIIGGFDACFIDLSPPDVICQSKKNS